MLSCLGNRRGEEKIVERGTSTLLQAMAASGVPRMAMVSSIGVGDSGLQLLRLGFGGWVFAALFSTLLRGTKHDLLTLTPTPTPTLTLTLTQPQP